jgi:hypothetical protein
MSAEGNSPGASGFRHRGTFGRAQRAPVEHKISDPQVYLRPALTSDKGRRDNYLEEFLMQCAIWQLVRNSFACPQGRSDVKQAIYSACGIWKSLAAVENIFRRVPLDVSGKLGW